MITWVPDEMDIVSGFVVEVSYYGPCSGVDETYTLTFNGTRRRHIFTGLQMGSTYTVSVTAMNRVGNTTTLPGNTPLHLVGGMHWERGSKHPPVVSHG